MPLLPRMYSPAQGGTIISTEIPYYSWLFSDPTWARQEREALPRLRRMRMWSVPFHLGLLGGVLLKLFPNIGF